MGWLEPNARSAGACMPPGEATQGLGSNVGASVAIRAPPHLVLFVQNQQRLLELLPLAAGGRKRIRLRACCAAGGNRHMEVVPAGWNEHPQAARSCAWLAAAERLGSCRAAGSDEGCVFPVFARPTWNSNVPAGNERIEGESGWGVQGDGGSELRASGCRAVTHAGTPRQAQHSLLPSAINYGRPG